MTPKLNDALTGVDAPHKLLLDGIDDAELFADTDDSPAPWEPDEDATASINYTSGTTGRPKGVQLSHRTLWLHAVSLGWHLGVSPREVDLQGQPLFHCSTHETWILARLRAQDSEGNRARDESPREARNCQPESCPKEAQADVADRADRHDDHDESPDHKRIEDAVWTQLVIGDQRENHERGRREDEPVMHFLLGERLTDKAMQRRTGDEQHRDHHREAGGEGHVALGQRTEQERGHQRDLRGQPGILVAAERVGDNPGSGDERRADRQHRDTAKLGTEPADERHERERSHPGHLPIPTLTLAALALQTDQQADAERHQQVPLVRGDNGIGGWLQRVHLPARTDCQGPLRE